MLVVAEKTDVLYKSQNLHKPRLPARFSVIVTKYASSEMEYKTKSNLTKPISPKSFYEKQKNLSHNLEKWLREWHVIFRLKYIFTSSLNYLRFIFVRLSYNCYVIKVFDIFWVFSLYFTYERCWMNTTPLFIIFLCIIYLNKLAVEIN